jgi:hypothetical protein
VLYPKVVDEIFWGFWNILKIRGVGRDIWKEKEFSRA